MTADDWMHGICVELANTPREGTETDEPEGSRFIRVSDTLARQICCNLERIANAMRGQIEIELEE